MARSFSEMKKWVKRNSNVTLDKLRLEDAKELDAFAAEHTMEFIRLARIGVELRCRQTGLPMPSSSEMMIKTCFVIRLMIMIAKDQYEGLPETPLFEPDGVALINSRAYKAWHAMNSGIGALA
ncbi:hypothetical protein KI809_19170 [Geobacter pelophilus]|uniref:Phage gp6-like head-tail connector protein n=1 Tax=Geoanaerobacter pelophilus TaxID=60036 RepID=A0AAW4L9A2_9BACT|nr:hypothetical protein [Geoanaerobacter pelophilus]MBT0666435.1 hypothetical protein [Geoanaerobacter pelophilus]